MTRWRGWAAAVSVLLLLAVAGCGVDTTDDPGSTQPQGGRLRITIGTQEFPEALLLGELWRHALAANGYVVDLRKGVGPAEDLDRALRDGTIDGYVAYTGTVLSIVAGEEVSGLDPQQTYDRAASFYADHGMSMTGMTTFENRDAIATTTAYADQHDLSTIADLAKVKGVRLGARPEFGDLYLGMTGLKEVYGLRATFVPLELGQVYAALDDHTVDAGNAFTTDPELNDGDYRVLADPQLLFGSQNAVMVVSNDKLAKVDKEGFLAVIDTVNERLTAQAMIDMNRQVTDGQSETRVAEQFLQQQGLLEPLGNQD